MKTIGSIISLVLTVFFISSCASTPTPERITPCASTPTPERIIPEHITPEHIENDILEVDIRKYETGRDGFEQIIISVKNNSDKELEFSAQSFFEDTEGRYNMINLPSKMYPNTTRTVAIRRAYYRGEDSVSFGFTGNFWGITGFELDKGSSWRISNSDLNVHDVYLTLIFKIDDKIYNNTYHLHY